MAHLAVTIPAFLTIEKQKISDRLLIKMEVHGPRKLMLESFLASNKLTREKRAWMSVRCAQEKTLTQHASIRQVSLDQRTSRIRLMFFYLHLALCDFIGLRGHNVFVLSLIDPFFVDCIIFHRYSSTYSIDKFHDIHSIQRSLWWFYVRCL